MAASKRTPSPRAASKRTPLPQDLVSVQQLADFCGVSVKTIYHWNTHGTGPKYSRVGVHVRYRWADINQWLDSRVSATSL